MWETITTTLGEFFTNGEIWSVIIKVLVTALLTAGLGYVGTLIGKAIAKNKESKIYKYASKCVRAAEMKFPNEGKKMGPEKMQYVMDQLAIKFPKIKENTYLYNIAEAAVFELNKENEKEAAIKEFEEKYGEKPIAVIEQEENESSTTIIVEEEKPINSLTENEEKNEKEVSKVASTTATTTKKKTKLNSF